jgi:hypothetical protein
MRARLVEPELLDELSPGQPEAQASRRDLRRINKLMGHARIFSSAWRDTDADQWCSRIVDLGGGDGNLLLQLARRIGSFSRVRTAVIVDRQPIIADETRREFERLGWKITTVSADVFKWLSESPTAPNTFLLANLFLHHFQEQALQKLLRLIAQQGEAFAACEPWRSAVSLAASRLLGFIGCNPVTRHDAVISVRAGFRGRELTDAWGQLGNWELHEREAGLFSHLLWGRKKVH